MFLFLTTTQTERNARKSGYKVTQSDDRYDLFGFFDAHSVKARLKQRKSYPKTYCKLDTSQEVLLGYGPEAPSSDDEFLHISLTRTGVIEVVRDVHCTLPLFYGYDGATFVVSNSYEAVCASLPHLRLNPRGVAHTLVGATEPLITVWDEVHILGERETLRFDAIHGKLSKQTPPARSWRFNSELTPTQPRDFPDFFESRLKHFVDTRLRSADRVGLQISGGLDSSILPLYLRAHSTDLSTVNASFALPANQAEHEQKIRTLQDVIGRPIHIEYPEPDHDYPLAPNLQHPAPFYPSNEIYEAVFARVADYFQSQGVDVMVNGFGGDELFEHLPDDCSPERYGELPNFLLPGCPLPEPTPHAATTLLASTTLPGTVTANNMYIDRDIWPVSPYYDVPLFNFCQALPVQFRANKNILRAYCEAYRFPPILYRYPKQEYFAEFFRASFFSPSYARFFRSMTSSRCITELYGFVDPLKVQALYDEALDHEELDDQLIHLYAWLALECSLRWTTFQPPRAAQAPPLYHDAAAHHPIAFV